MRYNNSFFEPNGCYSNQNQLRVKLENRKYMSNFQITTMKTQLNGNTSGTTRKQRFLGLLLHHRWL